MGISCNFSLDRYPYNRPRLEGLTTSCQFEALNPELDESGDHTWCIFHLPEEAKKQWEPPRIERFNNLVADYIRVTSDAQSLIDLSGVVFPGPVSTETLGTKSLPAILF